MGAGLEEVRKYRNQIFGIFFLSLIVFTQGANPEDLRFGIVLIGMFVRLWAAGYLIKRQRLTTWGPYGYVRNPLYVGTFLIGLGLCIVQRSLLFLAIYLAVFAFVYHFQIKHEEETLEEKFGEDYREYCRHVPRFFPRVTPYRGSEGGVEEGFKLSYVWKNKGIETVAQVVAVFLVLDLKEDVFIPFLQQGEPLRELLVNYLRHFV